MREDLSEKPLWIGLKDNVAKKGERNRDEDRLFVTLLPLGKNHVKKRVKRKHRTFGELDREEAQESDFRRDVLP